MIKLFPHQEMAVEYATETNSIFIETPVGTGKDVIISYLVNYYKNKDKNIIISTLSKEKFLHLLDTNIYILTHQDLIYKILFSDEDLSNYIFIIDEVDKINESMEKTLTYTFSLSKYDYLLHKLIEEIKDLDFRGQKTLIKGLFKLYYVLKDLKKTKKMDKIINFLTKEDFLKIKNKIEKLNIENIENVKKEFINEWNELLKIKDESLNDIKIYYSEKGYLILSVLDKEYYKKLESFWDKMENIKAFSATLTIPDKSDYYKKRLNIQKEVEYLQLNPVFDISQINYFIADKTFPKPNTTKDSVDIEWIKAIGNFIVETHENKNSLILMGGFLEVDNLYEYLENLHLGINLFRANRNKEPKEIIEEFENKGGILIATKNYGNEIDLKEKLFEKLYIAKLPYPVLGTKKWIELMNRDKLTKTSNSYFLMNNEMLLNLKQWIGRLIRTPNDKGNLYILDSRVNKINIKPRVEEVIKSSFKEF
jgi:ATP-dependent DNA helicase DinG